ncbi:hypothetical protein PAXRUDRAFT_791059, partial [Paxillus rubicundulus Ve08.2h10]
ALRKRSPVCSELGNLLFSASQDNNLVFRRGCIWRSHHKERSWKHGQGMRCLMWRQRMNQLVQI